MPHFCNYCKNHGVVTGISHGHAKNCPWRECVCALCMRTRNRNLYRRSLNKRSHEPAGPSSDMAVESSQSLASTSVANVLSAVNDIQLYLQLTPQLHVLLPELVSVFIL